VDILGTGGGTPGKPGSPLALFHGMVPETLSFGAPTPGDILEALVVPRGHY